MFLTIIWGMGKPGAGVIWGECRTGTIGLSLYNLKEDPGETQNLADAHPQVVELLIRHIEPGRKEFGDAITGTPGSERVDHYWKQLDEHNLKCSSYK